MTSRLIDIPADIPAGLHNGTHIPITTIEGARPGPTLALIAGNHGYEYPPILALQQLRTQIDAAGLSGTVILVHVANMPSFLGRTIYFSPIDGKNLNRVYPGRADGKVSERRLAAEEESQVVAAIKLGVEGDPRSGQLDFSVICVLGIARLDTVGE